MPENVLKILQERGFVEWCSDPDELSQVFQSRVTSGYIGFDPTADSLHVGHLVPIMGLAWLQRAGHQPIAVAGGGTGLIGDPSGKTKERQLLTLEQVERNLSEIKKQIEHFLDFDCGASSAKIVNNYSWLSKLGLIEFLRDVGKYFTVNFMLARDYVRSRIEDPEKSITYTEFSYILLQAYDFYHLYQHENCALQMGGNDQQVNIIAGIDLIRKKLGAKAYGLTYPLLLTASGQKFGKTEEGTVWLSPVRTTPYKFYQFWINADDRDVEKFLKLFTFLPIDDIKEVMSNHARHPERREAQKILAGEITRVVHGDNAAKRVKKVSEILFGEAYTLEDLTLELLEEIRQEVPSGNAKEIPSSLVDVLVHVGACASKSEARRLIRSGGVSLNGERVDEENYEVDSDNFLYGKYMLLKLGKKRYHLVERG
ncbi:tyrosine--tRNA ligase [Acetomicrobium sp.]|uniref:tyrosine--tRNA ligase n=1 Tax=Acetomicrobium sp. TaxID=1872099 RepID=UPI001BCB272B|nr:tyrosine--tRNA ligase [Acetomicrobium sp.]